jgi:hypothetical protein
MKRVILFALAIATASCGDLTRQGTASSYLIIDSLEAASGASPDEFGGSLASDVITVTDKDTGATTIYQDLAVVDFSLGLKDPGTSGNANEPTPTNFITITRYRVRYIRADGRNTPGVDVPYGFDGAMTLTVNGAGGAGTFTLVRAQAKAEAPLAALANNFLIISTIAEVTFYGRDQTGREVEITGRIGVDFGNWGDPV